MAFVKPVVKVPVAIGRIEYEFADRDGTVPGASARVHVQMLDASGEPCQNSGVGDLMQYLTAQEKTQLWAMMQRLRALAASELL